MSSAKLGPRDRRPDHECTTGCRTHRVEYPLLVVGGCSGRERRERVETPLDSVGMARALVGDPKVEFPVARR